MNGNVSWKWIEIGNVWFEWNDWLALNVILNHKYVLIVNFVLMSIWINDFKFDFENWMETKSTCDFKLN